MPKTAKSLLIQGNKEFGDSEKIRAYFKELVDVHPEVKDKSDDIKLQTVDSLIKNVRPVALHNAKKLLKDMKTISVTEEGLYWQKVPEGLKKKNHGHRKTGCLSWYKSFRMSRSLGRFGLIEKNISE